MDIQNPPSGFPADTSAQPEVPVASSPPPLQDIPEPLPPPPQSSKESNKKVLGLLVILFLAVSLPAAIFIAQQQQDIRQRASSIYPECAADSYASQCSGQVVGFQCGADVNSRCNNTDTDPKCSCSACLPDGATAGQGASCCSGQSVQVGDNVICGSAACSAGSDPRCVGRGGGFICENATGLGENKYCFPTAGSGSACECRQQVLDQCPVVDTVLGAPHNRNCIANHSNTDDCIGKNELSPCKKIIECSEEAGVCIAVSGDNVRGQCACVSGAGTSSPAPSGASPAPSSPTYPTPTYPTPTYPTPTYPTPGVPPPPASPLPSGINGAQCKLVKVYKVVNGSLTSPANWHLLTAAELTQVQAGETLYFTVLGETVGAATITQARLRMTVGTATPQAFTQTNNGTTTTKPKANASEITEYYKAFTVPSGLFKVDAEVYSPLFDTNTNPWDANTGWR